MTPVSYKYHLARPAKGFVISITCCVILLSLLTKSLCADDSKSPNPTNTPTKSEPSKSSDQSDKKPDILRDSNLPSSGFAEAFIRMLLVLGSIIAVLLLLRIFLPRFLNPKKSHPSSNLIQVVDTHQLEPRKTLYLVKVADQYILIGSTGDRLTNLTGQSIDPRKLDLLLNEDPTLNKSFAQILNQDEEKKSA